MGLMVK
jgi:glutathione synthase